MVNNAYVIQSKDKKLIQNSSSGGMFAELAKYTLLQGGIVFGCAMEKNEEGFDVKHIYIEDEKDLYKLQGSKYVQSNMGNTIKEAKEFLDIGRLVLFSGTPCQIAGLKAFLKKDYNNLVTVDLSCEGTPSLNIFNDYIKYLENNVIKHKIIDFKFRSKKHFGWSTSGLVAIYEKNGKIYEKILPQNLSSYFTYFLHGYILQDRCFECKYTGVERISDITIADAWGIEKEYDNLIKTILDKNKGISLVLINTLSGQDIYNRICQNINFEIIDIKKLRKYNHPLRHPSIRHANRNYYLTEYKNNGYEGLEKLFRKELGAKYYYYKIKNHTPKFIKNIFKLFMNKKDKVDCLLYTMFYHPNYGSLLTAYALQRAIEKTGYRAKHIYCANFYGYNKSFINKHLKITKKCVNDKDLKKLNQLTDTFIIGSDNLLNLKVNNIQLVSQALLNFSDTNKKRLMISGSIGEWNGATKNQEEHDYIKYLLDRFDYVSTREEHGKQVLEDVYNIKADWINDPIFYLDKQDFVDLTKDIKQDYSNNIMQYILYPTEKTQRIVEYYKRETGLEIAKFDGNENVKHFSHHENQTVENWLSAIINSKLVITDSFHCAAFCLIFNKQFICIKNTHAAVRFTSLFKRLGIDIPLIESEEDLKNANLHYDKELVNKSLEDIRNHALDKIEKALVAPKKETPGNIKMIEYNEGFMKKNTPWYKKNKFFYYGVIVPFVIPIQRLMADIKNEYNKKNK